MGKSERAWLFCFGSYLILGGVFAWIAIVMAADLAFVCMALSFLCISSGWCCLGFIDKESDDSEKEQSENPMSLSRDVEHSLNIL